MWARADMVDMWDELPLVFDNRNPKRELKLVKQHMPEPISIGLSLHGWSSPMLPNTIEAIKAALNKRFGTYIDISAIQGEHFYDLLGILDRIDCLVASDSAVLHLGYANKVPTVALTADTPTLWYGSRPRKHWVNNYRYSVADLSINSICNDVDYALRKRSSRLIHVYSEYEGNGDTQRRIKVARQACRDAYSRARWTALPLPDSELPRLFDDDTRKLPFVHDILNAAVKVSRPSDIIVYTNSDVCLSPHASEIIEEWFDTHEAGYSYRRDFEKLETPITQAEFETGTPYSGADLFAVRSGWWRNKKDWFPDFVIGAEAWDWSMRAYIDKHHGSTCNMPDCIYHERHTSEWEQIHDSKANVLNRQRARSFLSELGDYHGEFERKYQPVKK